MTAVGRLRSRFETRALRARADLYAQAAHDAERRARQLELLNESWGQTCSRIPYFRELRARADLPARFDSLDEFAARVPVMNRQTLQQHGVALTSPERPQELVRITGGSTAEPVQIPAWHSEFAFTKSDMWLARSWYGIAPHDRLFLLWGHSHLLGTGWRGFVNGQKRRLSDRLLGYCRYSAYDLGEAALRRGADALLGFRPAYVVGYSVALDLFARANAARRDALRAAGVRLVVAAAEGFPAPDSEARIADLFGCPVAMEYGSVETGLVAHTHPDGGYRTFWRSYLLEAERVGSQRRVRVTSLFPRCVPLVRYELGDELELAPDAGSAGPSVLAFARVIGRSNDYVALADGFLAHSEAFTHCVRACVAIQAYQVVQDARGIRLHYVAARDLDAADAQGVRERLRRIHPDLAGVALERVAALQRTVAGKTPMVIRRISGEPRAAR
jgi:phenylacetate-coenzyme A ligase PaaK-like adenylate-forming protein